MKNLLKVLFVLFVSTSQVFAYSYAAAGKELSIDLKEGILKAVNAKDFKSALEIFEKNKVHYKYLNDDFKKGLYVNLETSLKNKDSKNINKYLELSFAAEILRRVDGGYKNIKIFNVSKVMLAKANKYYKLISPTLDKKTNIALKTALKNCSMSIGNPGLFGVGAKPYDIKSYLKNENIIKEIIASL